DPGRHLWAIYVVLGLLGSARAFAGPAAHALLPDTVPVEHFANAVAWSSSIWQVAAILGPALGGVFYAWTHSAAAVYGLTAALQLVSAALLSGMAVGTPRMMEHGESWWRQLMA